MNSTSVLSMLMTIMVSYKDSMLFSTN